LILNMSRIRILGPTEQLQQVLRRVQDLGLVHLIEPQESGSLKLLGLTPQQARHVRRVRKVAEDVYAAIALLGEEPHAGSTTNDLTLARAALIAGRSRRHLEALEARRHDLEEERALILKFKPFFTTFRKISESGLDLDGVRIFYLVLRDDSEQEMRRVRAALRETLGDGFELLSQSSESGEAAMILAVPKESGAKAELLLSEAGVQSLSLPDQFEEESVGATVQRMQSRLTELPDDLANLEAERDRIARERGRDLVRIRAYVEDHLATVDAMAKAAVTPRAFVLEGWIPSAAQRDLEQCLDKTFGGVVEVEAVTYIRGRSLPKLFIIIDEAQNLTPHEIKTVVSRAGEDSKVILTGDAYQIDNPYLDASSNGLTYVVERFKDHPIHGHITLAKSERSELASLAAELL